MEMSSDLVRRIREASRMPSFAPGPPGTISLAIGEPSFPTPEKISRSLSDAIASGATHYCPGAGLPALRAAVAEYESARRSPSTSELDASNVTVTHGGAGGLTSAILAAVNPGDVVAIADPVYSRYLDLVAIAGGSVARFTQNVDGTIDRESFLAASRTARMVVICQPSNPTGGIVPRSDWEFMAEATESAGSIILSDEAYSSILFDGNEFTSVLDVPSLESRGVLCQTFSKTYAMTGWRLGYLVGPKELIAAASTVRSTMQGSLNTAVQMAGVTALRECADDVATMQREYVLRREAMGSAISSSRTLKGVAPAGGFYYFCRYDAEIDSEELAVLAKSRGVTVRAGNEYGDQGSGHIRLSFAGSIDDIRQGVERLDTIVYDVKTAIA